MRPANPEEDARYMLRALRLAERGWGRVSPNPMVGAVVVRDGQVVGEGWHTEFGAAHAEVEALKAAGERARGATLYVTLEPCAHHGKTPPCSDAIAAAGVARVVYASPDPHLAARGGGEQLATAGIDVLAGVEEQLARDLNAPFFHVHASEERTRPWVELKLALSLDSRVADAVGRSTWITSDSARDEVHRMRARHDAIGVGIGTAIMDDPLLTVRGAVRPRRPPIRVVFDRSLRLPTAGRLAATARETPVWVVTEPESDADAERDLQAHGVRVIRATGLADGLRALRAEGVESLFVEGGARIASALLTGQLVDRLTLFHAPVLLGPEGASPFAGLASPPVEEAERWRLIRTGSFGPDTMVSLER